MDRKICMIRLIGLELLLLVKQIPLFSIHVYHLCLVLVKLLYFKFNKSEVLIFHISYFILNFKSLVQRKHNYKILLLLIFIAITTIRTRIYFADVQWLKLCPTRETYGFGFEKCKSRKGRLLGISSNSGNKLIR